MKAISAVFLTVCYELAIVLIFHTHRYVWPSISDSAFRTFTFNLWVVILYFSMFPLGLYDHFFFFNAPSFSIFSIFATVWLFLGPLVQNHYDPPGFRSRGFDAIKAIVIAPLGEEFIYRAFTCTLWENSGLSQGFTIVFSPILFGLSHFHHFFLGLGNRRSRLLAAMGQCTFTTVFGWWVAFLWCKSHSFLTISLIHSFCNFMQFPDFQGAITWDNPVERRYICSAYVIGLIGFTIATAKLAMWKSVFIQVGK
jgi:prenyl protein peptidase